ncbi:MAG: ATP-binding domain-containing protein, partial [Coriobacteriia bacterium]|nr:ATP-binding domain-containing protein [Coriobacteriia bacterium]
LLRIINTPRRGIGNTSIQAVQALAYREGLNFESALRRAISDDILRPAAKRACTAFVAALDEMRSYRGELARVVEAIITASGLLAHFEAQNTDEAAGRAENIREFVNVAAEFEASHADSMLASTETEGEYVQSVASMDVAVDDLADDPSDNALLFAFMEWLALRSDLDSLSGESDTVTMMTVHTAKGLEYPVVLVAGMEESLFPHANSIYDSSGLEEERRLAYVAITRARERLILTRAAGRMSFGAPTQNPPSRFIAEIPEELLHTQGVGSDGFAGTSGWDKRGDRRGTHGHGLSHGYGGQGGSAGSGSRSEGASRSIYDSEPASYGSGMPKAKDSFAVGDTVNHKMWGRGKIVEVKGDSLTINFESKGIKKLMAGFAPIVKIQ